MNTRLALPAMIAGLMVSVPAIAHHSFSAEFDGSKRIELKGVVTKVEWANPHTFFYVDVKNANGSTVNWACETNGPNGLIRAGWKRDSLKTGDQVTVDGYRAKDGSNMMDARLVTLPGGRKVFAGNADDGGPKK
ncbi:MAG TPA: DUF6152 family protein [Bryobacteraceae bacterium]|jgi:hypothetical protein|nr:DUF6152 family protein [Bryobacteraceae bacterium]